MLLPILKRCGRFLRCERAVSALEYAVLAGIVIAAIGTAIFTFSDQVADAIVGIGTDVETLGTGLDPAIDESGADG